MQKITKYATTVAVMAILALSVAKTAVAGRLEKLDNDRRRGLRARRACLRRIQRRHQ